MGVKSFNKLSFAVYHHRIQNYTCVCVCVCVCLPSHPAEAPLNRPLRRLGYASPVPQAVPKDPVLIYTRGSTWADLFWGLHTCSLLKRSVCNSKGLLRAPRFSIRARVYTLRFCSR